MILDQAEFDYKNMKNRSTSKCFFEIVYTKALRLTFDLTNLPKEVELHEKAEDVVERIHRSH